MKIGYVYHGKMIIAEPVHLGKNTRQVHHESAELNKRPKFFIWTYPGKPLVA